MAYKLMMAQIGWMRYWWNCQLLCDFEIMVVMKHIGWEFIRSVWLYHKINFFSQAIKITKNIKKKMRTPKILIISHLKDNYVTMDFHCIKFENVPVGSNTLEVFQNFSVSHLNVHCSVFDIAVNADLKFERWKLIYWKSKSNDCTVFTCPTVKLQTIITGML